ncbi:MAG: KUP/HAK/KT family potassium transporter [Planctomycetota bacterium]
MARARSTRSASASHGDYATEVSRANVFGVVSLIFWTLLLVVCVKYLVFVLRARTTTAKAG